MDYYYYEKQFDLGNGEKFALTNVDSCFLLCATVTGNEDLYYERLDEDSKATYASCDPDMTAQANKMMAWIEDTLKAQAEDPSVVWKASNMHHPMYGAHYNDNTNIIDHFLPLAEKYGLDAYFNGHEHLLNYAYIPKGESHNHTYDPNSRLEEEDDTCHHNAEFFPEDGPEKDSRFISWNQGDALHQMTIGASGQFTYNLCDSHMQSTAGHFKYIQNKRNGFAIVHATSEKFTVEIKGIDYHHILPIWQPF
mmetsp:Transcript_42673/g.65459  ORF Transcript_42673/g.65459 Transcript_42673/m.65459 type:complete len:251 (+) Transcript_42673:397-1149(+)